MQNIFYEVNTLDKRCYEEFHLSEDILMEHAANGMATYIKDNYTNKKSILIVCGSGNNGADGITLARLLYSKYKIYLYIPKDPKSDMAKIQLERAKLVGIDIFNKFKILKIMGGFTTLCTLIFIHF